MSAGSLFFALCTVVCIVGALSTVVAKSPIRSAVGLLVCIFGIAGLFLMLNAQFLSAIQLIVYAGAIVVLFVFVIMLLGTDAGKVSEDPTGSRVSRVIAVLFMVGLAVAAVAALASTAGAPELFPAARPEHGSVEAVGGQLFTKGIIPFELATALLIVAVIGAIAVARSKHVAKRTVLNPHETRRLFAGPVHPRDAGHPLPKEPVP
jgi:NADH-quinone oxidoreductase subunit J